LVAYLLGLTKVDPIKYNLLFERFLNPTRKSQPDCDTDICYEKRDLVFDYIVNKYGEEHTCRIGTFGKLTVKSVMRKLGSISGKKSQELKAVTAAMHDKSSDEKNIEKASALFKESTLINTAGQLLVNNVCQMGRHAAGIIVSPIPVNDIVPLWRLQGDKYFTSQWDKKQCEKLNLYKFDILALQTLTLIDKCEKAIGINMDYVALDDDNVYDMLRQGRLTGVFQLEGASAKEVVQEVQPTCFNDIVVCTSICRPGVIEAKDYISGKYAESKESILADTRGAIVFQEQAMLLMNKYAGWDLGKCDAMRKVDDLDDYKDEFLTDSVRNGFDRLDALQMFSRFDLAYSFNKSHAVAYSIISYQTAWLKFHYPEVFYCNLMNINLGDKDKLGAIVACAVSEGTLLLPCDFNLSAHCCTVGEKGIRIGLEAVDGLGEKAVEEILAKRPFDDLADLVERCEKRKVNSKVVGKLMLLDNPEKDYRKEIACYGFAINNPVDTFHFKQLSEYEEGDNVMICGLVSEVKIIKDKRGQDMAFLTFTLKNEKAEGLCFSFNYRKLKDGFIKGYVIMVEGKKSKGKVLIEKVKVYK